MKKTVLLALMLAVSLMSMAQRKCVVTEVEQLTKTPEQIQQEKAAFENWLLEKRQVLLNKSGLQEQTATTIYTIPVVVHIIHTGEPYGFGYNIKDEQIYSQLEVLNRDYRHLNPDSINTPPGFQPLAADVGFEFVLAKQTPTGLSTNGITRTNGGQSNWTRYELDQLKSLSYWDSNNYLNIWVAPSNDFLGWAQFPTSTILDGLNDQTTGNPLTDGVVIATTAFGSSEFYPQGDYQYRFDLGRTATHEIGHFFGLRHVWGDGDCSVDDYVTDTPQTNDSYYFCPAPGTSTNACVAGEASMFMNFMDYVDDDCMNLFSLGQKDRMIIVVNNSPRRASLLTSPALDPPPPFDVAVAAIPTPGIGTCSNLISADITIENTGSTTISEIDLSILVDGTKMAQQVFPVSILAGKDTTLSMPAFSFTAYGNLEFEAKINAANGFTQDDNPVNNSLSKIVFNSETVTTLNEEFNSWPSTWAVRTEAPISNWSFFQAPNLEISNMAAALKYYEVKSAFYDQFITPKLDLNGYTSPKFVFNYAYGERPGFNDVLAVLVSTDCGNTFTDTLFLKSSPDLATTTIPVAYTPSGPVEWHTTVLDLSNYTTQRIQLAFIGKTDGGNNIYLDNFRLVDNNYTDIGLAGLENESGAYLATIPAVGLIVQNNGTTTIDNFAIEAMQNNSVIGTTSFTNMGLLPGMRKTVYVANGFAPGVQQLAFTLNLNDANTENNTLTTAANFISTKELIPYREHFNTGTWNTANDWTLSSPFHNPQWALWTSTGNYLAYEAATPGNLGLHDWLVLPPLDLSQTTLASMQFKVAYAGDYLNREVFRIYVSTNGGKSFDYLLDTYYGNKLNTANGDINWSPATNADWETLFFDLTEFTGNDNLLIAFETIDGSGRNIYIDDVDIYITNEPTDIEIDENVMAIYPNPVTNLEAKISFSLDNKQNIQVRVIDMQGNLISDQVLLDVVNQTYMLELANRRNGMYIIQAIGESFSQVTRIVVSR